MSGLDFNSFELKCAVFPYEFEPSVTYVAIISVFSCQMRKLLGKVSFFMQKRVRFVLKGDVGDECQCICSYILQAAVRVFQCGDTFLTILLRL